MGEEERVFTYFLPKLTEKEKKLVEEKDKDHLMSYADHALLKRDPDVSKKEMDESESKSKFVRGWCWRVTFILNVESMEGMSSDTEDQTISGLETSSESSSEIIRHEPPKK